MAPTPDEVPGATPPSPAALRAEREEADRNNEPEITDEPEDVQEESPAVVSPRPAHGLADNGEGEFILNESGTSVSIDPVDE